MVPLKSQETLLKYVGGLHSYLHHTILLFNPSNLDQVCVQAQHLETHGKSNKEDKDSNKKPQGDGKVNATSKKVMVRNFFVVIVIEIVMVMKNVGNSIQNCFLIRKRKMMKRKMHH